VIPAPSELRARRKPISSGYYVIDAFDGFVCHPKAVGDIPDLGDGGEVTSPSDNMIQILRSACLTADLSALLRAGSTAVPKTG
jgi:hypothetical protein